MLMDGRWQRGKEGRAIADMLEKQRKEQAEAEAEEGRRETQRVAGKEAVKQAEERRFSRSYATYQVWMEKTARTTRYQQRIIQYMQRHPDASLSEARGHTKNVKRS